MCVLKALLVSGIKTSVETYSEFHVLIWVLVVLVVVVVVGTHLQTMSFSSLCRARFMKGLCMDRGLTHGLME